MNTCAPSTSVAAKFTATVSAIGVVPPAAATASTTRASAASRKTPGERTAPVTCTTSSALGGSATDVELTVGLAIGSRSSIGGGGTRTTHHAPITTTRTPVAAASTRDTPNHRKDSVTRARTPTMCARLEELGSQFLAMTRHARIVGPHGLENLEIAGTLCLVGLDMWQQLSELGIE